MLKKVFAAFFSFLSISLLLTVSLPVASYADDEKELRLICDTGYTQVENMLWKVYHIGERKNNEFQIHILSVYVWHISLCGSDGQTA